MALEVSELREGAEGARAEASQQRHGAEVDHVQSWPRAFQTRVVHHLHEVAAQDQLLQSLAWTHTHNAFRITTQLLLPINLKETLKER